MSTVIKPRRGSGDPAGSLAQNEIAMDIDANKLYVSSDGSDSVLLADNTDTFLRNNALTLTCSPSEQLTYLNPDDSSSITQWVYEYQPAGILTAMSWRTANTYKLLSINAIDTGGGDDGTHDMVYIMNGGTCALQGRNEDNSYTQLYLQGTEVFLYNEENSAMVTATDSEVTIGRPLIAEERIEVKDGNDNRLFEVTEDVIECSVPPQLPGYDLTSGPYPNNPNQGMMAYNTTTNRPAFYNGTTWTDL